MKQYLNLEDNLEKGVIINLGEGKGIVENDMNLRVYFRWKDTGRIGWVYRKNIESAYKKIDNDRRGVHKHSTGRS